MQKTQLMTKNNLMVRGLCRTFHVMTKTARHALPSEEPVPLYESPDHSEFEALGEGNYY